MSSGGRVTPGNGPGKAPGRTAGPARALATAILLIAGAASARDLPAIDAAAPSPQAQKTSAAASGATGPARFERLFEPTQGLQRTTSDRRQLARQLVERVIERRRGAHTPLGLRLEGNDLQALDGGASVARFALTHSDLTLFRGQVAALLDRDGNLIALSSDPALWQVRDDATSSPRFVLGEADAIAAALAAYRFERTGLVAGLHDPRQLGAYRVYAGDDLRSSDDGARVTQPIRIKRVLFPLQRKLRPAYYIETQVADTPDAAADYYAHVIAADDGSVLFRMRQEADHAYRGFIDGSGADRFPLPSPEGRTWFPHPTGTADFFAPPFISTFKSDVPTNMPTFSCGTPPALCTDPWLQTGATFSAGNNVDAYVDFSGSDGLNGSDFRADVTTALPPEFNRAFDPNLSPTVSDNQRKAAVTQLFYWVNWLHDFFYPAGFDERAGNAQLSNYGRGGFESDAIKAEAQDRSGVNNANMSTPGDGGQPRMQMFLWSGAIFGTPSGSENTRITFSDPSVVDGFPGWAMYGPQNFDISGDLVRVDDGTGASPNDACEPVVNGAALSGKVVVVDYTAQSGDCASTVKVTNIRSAAGLTTPPLGIVLARASTGGGNAFLSPITPLAPDVTQAMLAIGSTARTALLAAMAAGPVKARLERLTRDGDLDGSIVAHEWGHYLSNRLIGDGIGLSENQARGLGEGWSDFVALLTNVRPRDLAQPGADDFRGTYGEGAYAVGAMLPARAATADFPALPARQTSAYYYGLRRYPYSSELSKSPLTLRHIADGEPLPSTPPPSFGREGATNSEVHNTGEVWSAMLWQCYSGLLRDRPRLDFDSARLRMAKYLVAGLKLTPVNPTLLEARDALLTAMAAVDSNDFTICANAFAQRGAGLRAVAADRYSSNNIGVVEDFSAGGDLRADSIAISDANGVCDVDGILDNGETGVLTIRVTNVGYTALSASTATVSSTELGLSFPAGNRINLPASQPYQTVTATLPVALTGAPTRGIVQVRVRPDDPQLALRPGRDGVFDVLVDSDAVPASSRTEDFSVRDLAGWVASDGPATGIHWSWRGSLNGSGEAAAPDSPVQSQIYLSSPPIAVGSDPLIVAFVHRHDFEAGFDPVLFRNVFYDGGVVEISADGGNTWVDIGTSAYGGQLESFNNPQVDNPFAGRRAFVYRNASYPQFDATSLDLGTSFAGQTVRLRFGVGTDAAAGAGGWEIDRVTIAGATNAPFWSIGNQAAGCPLSPLLFANDFE